jgi:UrcA family protein
MDTFRLTRRLPLLCLAIAGAACVATAAQAQPPLTVSYRDLDLSTMAGATTLYGRIREAASITCGEEGRGIDARRKWEQCFHSAVSGAVGSVHNSLLTTLDSNHKSMTTALLTK